MPELPDVEVYRRYLNATSLHQRIRRTHLESPSLLDGTSPQALGRALKDRTFESTVRHGKYLLAASGRNRWLVLHFGMSGRLDYFRDRADIPDYTRCLFTFENGFHLAYVAPRKLGRIALIDSPQALVEHRELGGDALATSVAEFRKLASAHRGSVKSWLMNQRIMAGIGNVYSDEILFQACVHPRQPIGDLDAKALERLHRAMRSVLNSAIDAGAEPDRMPATFLLPHREHGGRCPCCHTRLATVRVGGRTAWYCPRCQRL
jgi:formamidopyrimidine-DNA glycosylase